MTESDNTQEEPQEVRGEPGSRDEGEGPQGGPTDRPSGRSESEDHSGVNPLEPIDPDMPTMPAGDQGG